MGGVLLKEERMRGDEEKHLSGVSGKSPREPKEPIVLVKNKIIHFQRKFNITAGFSVYTETDTIRTYADEKTVLRQSGGDVQREPAQRYRQRPQGLCG